MTRTITMLFSLMLFAPLATVNASEIEAPHQVLERTSEEVIAVLKQRSEEIKNKPDIVYELVDDYILPHLDDVTMAKLALGKSWKKATTEQKKQFVNEFRTLLIKTYSRSLQEFSDQQINFYPAQADGKKAVVRSEVLQSGGLKIPMSFRMRLKNDAWLVYDISIDGVSLVTSYRGTFTQEVRKGGIEGLLQMLADRNASMNTDATGES